MILPNSEQYLEDLKAAQDLLNRNLSVVQRSFGNKGFSEVAAKGFNLTNVKKDLNENVSLIVPLGTPVEISTGEGNVPVYSNIPMQPEYGAKGVKYINPVDPSQVIVGNPSTTVATDRADGDKSQSRWITRCIFKFRKEDYGYDRCVYEIPVQYLMEGIVGDEGRHSSTLNNYPYPEEIIMISKDTEKNFIHFINVQYEDGHCGHFNGRDYNFMCVFDRTKYGVVNSEGDAYAKYTSLYANSLEDSLAFYKDGYLYLPMPDRSYGDDLLDTLWDCRVIWRGDSPTREIDIQYEIISNEMRVEENVQDTMIGADWSKIDQIFSGYPTSIQYGAGMFITVTNKKNRFYYSTDGKIWTAGAYGYADLTLSGLDYCGDRFIANAYRSDIIEDYHYDVIVYSTNGINWTIVSVDQADFQYASPFTMYGSGKYVIPTTTTTLEYSTDGISWTTAYIGGSAGQYDSQWTHGLYEANKFIVTASNRINGIAYHSLIYSVDGVGWTRVKNIVNGKAIDALGYIANKYIIAAGPYNSNAAQEILYSVNGISWTVIDVSLESVEGTRMYNFVYNSEMIIGIRLKLEFIYSYDGITWYKSNPVGDSSSTYFQEGCYGDSKFIVISTSTSYTPWLSESQSHLETIDMLQNAYICDTINGRIIILSKDAPNGILFNAIDKLSSYRVFDKVSIRSIIGNKILLAAGGVCVYPNYLSLFNLLGSSEAAWKLSDIPNILIELSNDSIIGLSYMKVLEDGSRVRNTQVTYNLFNSRLHVKNPINSSLNPTHYPCKDIVPNIDGSNILAIIDTPDTSLSFSILYVYTTSAKYKVTVNLLDDNQIKLNTEKISNLSEIGNATIERINDSQVILIRDSDGTVFLDTITDSKYIKNPFGLGAAVGPYYIGRYHLIDVSSTRVNARCDYSASQKFHTLPTGGTSDDSISSVPSYNNIKMHDGKLNIVENASGDRKISILREKYTLSGEFLVNPK